MPSQTQSIWDDEWEPIRIPRLLNEKSFQRWYRGWANATGIPPDPDVPEHKYDYWAAYKAGAIPEYDSSAREWHWPPQFKAEDHSRRTVLIQELAAFLLEKWKKVFGWLFGLPSSENRD